MADRDPTFETLPLLSGLSAAGRAELLLASPLFPRIVVHRASGQTIAVRALGAALDTFYVHGLQVNGRAATRAWLPESFVSAGGTLEFTLSRSSKPSWGSAPADAPPSFGPAGSRIGRTPYP